MPDLKHFIRVYERVLEPEFCRRIIGLFESLTQHQSERVRRHPGPGGEIGWRWLQMYTEGIAEFEPVEARLREIACRHAERYAKDVGLSLFPFGFEEFKIKRYSASGSECFPPHVDLTHTGTMHRMLAVLWYLNDVASGGETYFGPLGLRVAPRAGSMLMFPPTWMYPHAGMPPRSGPKYIIGTYFKYQPVADKAADADGSTVAAGNGSGRASERSAPAAAAESAKAEA
jgi:hypothetical protein